MKKGFTIIELVVVIAIIALVVGGGLASYSTLGSQQKLTGETSKLRNIFETAKRQAISGDGNDVCTNIAPQYEVQSFQVAINPLKDTGGKVEVKVGCFNSSIKDLKYITTTTYTIDKSAPIQKMPITIEFAAETGAATLVPGNSSPITLKTSSNKVSCVTISSLGVIDEGKNAYCLPPI